MHLRLVRAPAPTPLIVDGDVDVRVEVEFCEALGTLSVSSIREVAVPQMQDVTGDVTDAPTHRTVKGRAQRS